MSFGDILIGGIILIVVVLITARLYNNKKEGKSSCGCGCDTCGSAGVCHSKPEDSQTKK